MDILSINIYVATIQSRAPGNMNSSVVFEVSTENKWPYEAANCEYHRKGLITQGFL